MDRRQLEIKLNLMTKDKLKTKTLKAKEKKKKGNEKNVKVWNLRSIPIWQKLLVCGGIHQADISNVVEGV